MRPWPVYAKRGHVTLLEDGGVKVYFDDGRGIPTDIHPKTGKSTVETVLTVLHAGGKFRRWWPTKSPRRSAGAGSSVVNALSEKFIVEVHRDGKLHHQEYERGVPKTKLDVIKQNR